VVGAGEARGRQGVRIAFENCAMDGNWQTGDWNIAHNPTAWELIFNETPDDHVGLEWEPCHQLVYLIDPLPQIRKWGPKIFHVHGKDATVPLGGDPRARHLRQGGPVVWMRTPAFGDLELDRHLSASCGLAGFNGSIEHRGLARPVYRDELR
jgi:sugar phosphate isomerase/epimerase